MANKKKPKTTTTSSTRDHHKTTAEERSKRAVDNGPSKNKRLKEKQAVNTNETEPKGINTVVAAPTTIRPTLSPVKQRGVASQHNVTHSDRKDVTQQRGISTKRKTGDTPTKYNEQDDVYGYNKKKGKQQKKTVLEEHEEDIGEDNDNNDDDDSNNNVDENSDDEDEDSGKEDEVNKRPESRHALRHDNTVVLTDNQTSDQSDASDYETQRKMVINDNMRTILKSYVRSHLFQGVKFITNEQQMDVDFPMIAVPILKHMGYGKSDSRTKRRVWDELKADTKKALQERRATVNAAIKVVVVSKYTGKRRVHGID